MPEEDVWSDEWIQRKKAVLTKRDRKYLLGELDLQDRYDNPEEQERDIRSKIRKRVKNAVLDFELIASTLSPQDFTLMYGEEEFEPDGVDYSSDLQGGILGMVTLVTRMSAGAGLLAELIQTGVNDGLTLHGYQIEDDLYTGFAALETGSLLDDGRKNIPLDEISDSPEDVEKFLSQFNGKVEKEMWMRTYIALRGKWYIDKFEEVLGDRAQLVGDSISPKEAIEEVVEEIE